MAKEYLISDFLKRIKRPIELQNEVEYKLVTVKMNHNGVTLRELKKGCEIKSNMYLVKTGDFILSGIDARNGAFGIISQDLDNAIVTNDFWYFEIDENIILKELFLELTATTWFDEICKKGSDGTTQRIRLQKDKFFNQSVWLPEKREQETILDKIKSFKKNLESFGNENKNQSQLISQLRQSILQEAIQGKLTAKWREQNPNTEPAEKLLKRIKAEKEKLIKEKKIKKEKPLAEISENEIPFELPKGWVWCRFLDLVTYRKGKKPDLLQPKSDNNFTIPYIDIAAFEKNMVSNYTNDKKSVFCEPENILLVWDGARMGLVGKNVKGAVGSTLVKIDVLKCNVDYIFKLLQSYYSVFNKNPKQAGLPHMNGDLLDNLIIAIPPLEEQQAIVEKVETLLGKCKQLQMEIENLNTHSEDLLKALFNETFEKKEDVRICTDAEKAILAGHIINTTSSKDFGRVKLQKLLHLIEYHCKIDMGSNYVRKAAGPHDGNLINGVEKMLQRYNFYNIRKNDYVDYQKVEYTSLSAAPQLDTLFTDTFAKEAERIERFLTKFKNSTWEQCEIVSTLYAVWNNRLIKKQEITDELLKKDFLAWDKNKIKYKDRLDVALDWMKEKDVVPSGWGKYIDKETA